MDIYLPHDFYALRDDLPDWRDALPDNAWEPKSESRDEGADPTWQTL